MRKRRPSPARRCKGCSTSIAHKHVNAKFCCQRCKDRYHNTVNPRGYYDPENRPIDDFDGSWDAHKDAF